MLEDVWLVLRQGVFTCVRCQVGLTLCDPIWQVTLRSCEMDFHETAIGLHIFTFTFPFKAGCTVIFGHRLLYWNDCSHVGGRGSLEVSNLDGRGRRTLLRGVGCVRSLTIDLPVQTLYWVNSYTADVGYCPLSNCTKVQRNISVVL